MTSHKSKMSRTTFQRGMSLLLVELAAFGAGVCAHFALAQAAATSAASPLSAVPAASFHFGVPAQEPVKTVRGQMQTLQPRNGTLAYTYDIPKPKGKMPDGNGYTPYMAYSLLTFAAAPTQVPQAQAPTSSGTAATLVFQALRNPGNERSLEVLYEPQFTPDGRYLLLKFGVPWSFETTYELYVFDTMTRTLRRACDKEGIYEFTSWSPDGKYIAFMAGGNAAGEVEATHLSEAVYTGPLQLYVCEWRTGKLFHIATNDTLRGPFTWLAPHTLFYGMLSPESQRLLERQSQIEKPTHVSKAANQAKQPQKAAVVPRPDVYEYDIERGTSRLTIHDAYRPVPSPNGDWVAFYGSEHPDKPLPVQPGWEEEPQGAALVVAHRDGSGRIALNQEGGLYSFAQWLPDNQNFLMIKQTRYGLENEAEVREWNIATRRFRITAILHAHDYKFSPRSPIEPQFLPLSLSGDGQMLFMEVAELLGHDPAYPPIVGVSLLRQSLEAVDLASGRVSVVAQA